MKLHFRLKIALISFAVSGTLLTAFGIAFFAFTYSSGIERMDREIRALVESSLRGGHTERYWEDFGNSLKFIYGEGQSERIALLITDPENRILSQSVNAPKELAFLPRPERPEAPVRKMALSSTHFIERIDLNNDGKISHQEFDGPPHIFDRSDRNNDRFIDESEASQMQMPPQRRERLRGEHPPPGTDFREGPPPPSAAQFQNLKTTTGDWRVGSFSNPEVSIVVALDMEAFHADIHRFRNAFMMAVPAGLFLLGITGWFLANRAMRPVAIIADTAEGISAKGLNRRIPKVGNDIELERLVTVSNDMLDRLEKSYHQAVRFSADAAHELQTPLTILQGELDNAIQTSENGSTEQQRYSMLLEELRNLKAVVQKLLLLAHADEGRLNLNLVSVNLSELVQNAAEDIEIMAPGLEAETQVPAGVQVSADPALLNQVLRNMTSNAAKYAAENGKVIFKLTQTKEETRFTLSNTGDPIPKEDRPLLFERFHRVDKARTAAGSGLGLSLAREIARAHGGDLVLDTYQDGMVSFSLKLPAETE